MNSKISKNETEGTGNTQNPVPSVKPSQVPARIHHFFTFNNYSKEDIKILVSTFDVLCYRYVFQEEVGDSGNKHLQGIISCKKPTRDTSIGIPQIHWEKPRNVTDSYNYCSNPHKRHGDIWNKDFEVKYLPKLPDFNWCIKLKEETDKEPDRRKVFWIWSKKGQTGKSTMATYYVLNNAVFCSKGKYSDIVNILYKTNMNDKSIVIFDLPRNNGNKISYDAIEAIKNGLICNTKFETGYKLFKSPHIIVFANAEPEYEKLSNDRWVVVNIDDGEWNLCNP